MNIFRNDGNAPSNSGPPLMRPIMSTRPTMAAPVFVLDGFSQPFFLIRLLVLGVVPFFVVDAGFYQLEMWYSGGSAPITAAALKIVLLGILLLAGLFRGSIAKPGLMKISTIFLGYLGICALYQNFSLGVTPLAIASGYNIYYLMFFIDILAFCIPLRISDRLLTRLLLGLMVPCAVLGIAQYVTKSPIVPTASPDGTFTVHSWHLATRLKVFSFFDEPADCGIFFSLIAALAVAFCGRARNVPLAIPLLLLSIVMCWLAGARTEMLGVVATVASAVIFTFWGKRNRTRWLPLIWFLAGLPVAFIAYLLSFSSANTLLVTDTASFSARLARWSYFLGMFRASEISSVLLGFGLVQSTKIDPTGLSGSDNMFLANILAIGVVGLLLFMVFLWFIWEDIRKEAETRRSCLYIAVASTFSTVLLLGIYSIVTSYLGALVLLLSVCKVDADEPDGDAA
jgi:hypothetical protein